MVILPHGTSGETQDNLWYRCYFSVSSRAFPKNGKAQCQTFFASFPSPAYKALISCPHTHVLHCNHGGDRRRALTLCLWFSSESVYIFKVTCTLTLSCSHETPVEGIITGHMIVYYASNMSPNWNMAEIWINKISLQYVLGNIMGATRDQWQSYH